MHVISRRGLMKAAKNLDAATVQELLSWFQVARRASWESLDDIRASFPSADRVGRVLIFDIRNNNYRLIVRHRLPRQTLFVKAVLTHKQYDRKEWLKWS